MIRRHSLTYRLTTYFSITAAVTVIGMGWLLMYATEQHFFEIDRIALIDKKKLIQNILQNADSLADSRAKLNDSLANHHEFFALVTTQDGSILFQTEGFNLKRNFSESSHRQANQAVEIEYSGESQFIYLHFETARNGKFEENFKAKIALNTMHHQQFLIVLKRKLALYAIVAMIACGFLGWIAVHRGMAPLRAMRKQTAVVSPQQLQARIPIESLPREMADFAHELNLMFERLQNGFDRLLEFSADLAHELRTPLSNLLTQTQVMLSIPRSVEEYQNTLVSNTEELQRMSRMVSDMLFLAKTEHGIDLPTKERFLVRPEIESVISFYEALAEQNGFTLEVTGDASVEGDRLMIRRAITNLVSNAMRHTPLGGQISIEILDAPQSTFITVSNSGDEILPEALARVFDRFYRADSSSSQHSSEGTGLGLPIVQAIMQAHQGVLSAESARGKNIFRLEFVRTLSNIHK